MKFNKQSPLHLVLLCLIVFFQFSCSKDSDLLTDYVISDTSVSKGIANLVVDDTYQVSLSGSIVLDVLANDTFENEAVVVITETSTPENGTVAINNDETLTYTPNAEIIEQVSDTTETAVGEVVDTFTYTAEVVTGEGTATTEEANVVITTADNAARQEGVNLSNYGAVGDGVKDDTAALQAAFDNETNLVSDAGKTYLVSGTISLNQNMAQTIDFNGSKITRNVDIGYMLWIDKSAYANSLTTISNVDIDGNSKVGSLIFIKSRVHFTNIEVHHATMNLTSNEVRGIWNHITDSPGAEGQWVFDNVNIYWITNRISAGNSQDNSRAQGFYVYWPEKVTNGIQIVYKNSTIHDVWGREGDLMILNTPNLDISNTNNSLWFENMLMYNFNRRAVKNFIGNTTWVNCDFYGPDIDNPNIDKRYPPAGMFAMGAGSAALGSENNLICGCNFYGGYTKPLDSWENLVVFGGTTGPTGWEMRHSTINGDDVNSTRAYDYTGIKIGFETGAIKICDCEFTSGATTARGTKIVQGTSGALSGGKYQIDSNNTYAVGQTAALARLSTSKYDIVDLSSDCPDCPSIDD